MANLQAKGRLKGILLRSNRYRHVLLSSLFPSPMMQTFESQTVQIAKEPLKVFNGQTQLGGYLRTRRKVAELASEFAARLFKSTCLLPQISWTPIQLAQIIQNGTANAISRVGKKLHVFLRIEFIDSIDQPEHPGLDQIVERHMRR